MEISNRRWHILVRATSEGRGATRTWRYALSDVLLWTGAGNDPLADWQARNPVGMALWFTWTPLAGAAYQDATDGLWEMHRPVPGAGNVPPGMEAELLAGINLALRLDSGEFGEGVTSATTDPRRFARANGSADPPPSERIDPDTLEIKDVE